MNQTFEEIVRQYDEAECGHCGGHRAVEPHCKTVQCGWIYCEYCKYITDTSTNTTILRN